MDVCLEDVLRNEECDNLEKVLNKFFFANVPLSYEIIKLKKKKKYIEALTQLKNNKSALINECFFILSNIISSILKGYLKIENVTKNKRYYLIYIWFVPLCERKEKKINNTNFMINNSFNVTQKKKNNNKNNFFYGIYFSEWIILILHKIFSSLTLQKDTIAIENWSFVIDLMKFIYVDKSIIAKYLQGMNILNDFNYLESDSRNKRDASQNEIFNDSNFNKALENYYEDFDKITKAYFSFPFLLFKCITKGLKRYDEKRNLYIYNHVIPKQLNEECFYKNAVQLCAFSWFYFKDSNINYKKIIYLTKKIINLNLCDLFCSNLLYIFLQYEVSPIEESTFYEKERKEINKNKETNEDNNINKTAVSYLKDETKIHTLCNLNFIMENIFYYLHFYCKKNEGKIFLSCIMKKLFPFINIIKNNSIPYLCLFNQNVAVVLNIIINIVFLYEWNSYFLENFFNPFSRNCLPLCSAIAVIDIINNLIIGKSIYFISLFKNFCKKKKIIHSDSTKNEKRSYLDIVSELKNDISNKKEKDIDTNSIEILSANFLKELFFYILNIFSEERQEETEKIFISIILSKLLYIFGKHIKNINKKVVKNLYNFEILSKEEFAIYNISKSNINIFEHITNIIQQLFKCNDEVSLLCGQIVGEYFGYYVNNQSFKEKNKKYASNENESENNNECNKLIFPNLHQPIEYLPEQILCFKVIKQRKFFYLDNFILIKNMKRQFKIKEYSLRKIKSFLNIDNKEHVSDNLEEQCTEYLINKYEEEKKEIIKSQNRKSEYSKKSDNSNEGMMDKESEDKGKVDKENDDEENEDEESEDEENEDEENEDKESEDEESEDKESEDKESEDEESEDKESEDKESEDEENEDKGKVDKESEDEKNEVEENEDKGKVDKENQKDGIIFEENKIKKREFEEDEFKKHKDEEKDKNEIKSIDNNNMFMNKCNFDKKTKIINNNLMVQNASNIIENELYDHNEKEFLVKLEKENEFYLNLDVNKYMYIDPSEDLFECLNRLKEKANYIERNDVYNNMDVLKLNEKKENYEEETFRICQTLIFLPRLIKKCDILYSIGSNLYEVLLSLNNLSIINKGKDYFLTYKLFDMVLLSINSPVEISNFVFNNIYTNFYSIFQKMCMLLSLQFTALYLSNNIALNEIFEHIKNLMKTLNFSKMIMKKKHFLNEEADILNFSENYYDEFEKFPNDNYFNINVDKVIVKNNSNENENKNLINSSYQLNNKKGANNNGIISNMEKRNSSITSEECNSSNSLRDESSSVESYGAENILTKKNIYNKEIKRSANMKTVHTSNYIKKKKVNNFLKVCDFFFSSVYTKLFCLSSKNEMKNLDYDEYKIKMFYSSDSSLLVFLISSYTLFFNCSSNSHLYIDDILVDGFTIGNFFIQNKNFLVKRVTLKLLFHMIHFIFKKKKFYILENENYINVINYISTEIDVEKDFLSMQYMRELINLHKSIKIK